VNRLEKEGVLVSTKNRSKRTTRSANRNTPIPAFEVIKSPQTKIKYQKWMSSDALPCSAKGLSPDALLKMVANNSRLQSEDPIAPTPTPPPVSRGAAAKSTNGENTDGRNSSRVAIKDEMGALIDNLDTMSMMDMDTAMMESILNKGSVLRGANSPMDETVDERASHSHKHHRQDQSVTRTPSKPDDDLDVEEIVPCSQTTTTDVAARPYFTRTDSPELGASKLSHKQSAIARPPLPTPKTAPPAQQGHKKMASAIKARHADVAQSVPPRVTSAEVKSKMHRHHSTEHKHQHHGREESDRSSPEVLLGSASRKPPTPSSNNHQQKQQKLGSMSLLAGNDEDETTSSGSDSQTRRVLFKQQVSSSSLPKKEPPPFAQSNLNYFTSFS
jgi:hypothetical protein